MHHFADFLVHIFHHDVMVICHEAISEHLYAMLSGAPGQYAQKCPTVLLIEEDVLLVDAPMHEMMHEASRFHSGLSRHS